MKSISISIAFSILWFCLPAQNIHRTACQGNLVKLDSMLTHTPIDVKDNRGRSLMHWAVACKQKEVFDFLVQKGININGEDNQKKTPLHVAVQYGNEPFYDLLVEQQEDSIWIDLYGTSLLEQAVLNKDSLFINKLIECGLDINGTNERGSTALEISQRIEANNITQLLLDKGADKNNVRTFEMKGKYMSQEVSKAKGKMFAPNFISTEEKEFGSVFNSKGTEFYYGVDVNGKYEIRYSQLIDDEWSKPKTILSHKVYGYNDPFLSPDENRLYFISKRALDGLGEPKDVDIWYVEKKDDGWSDPINAGTNINSDRNEYYISFTNNGTMYFSSNTNASEERLNLDYDIYYSEFIAGEFQKPVALGDSINTEEYEADVFISPDESYMIFCSTRENGFGQGDLYISFRNMDRTWSPAINMGETINTHQYEFCPFVSKNGRYLFYTSNHDIFWISTEVINQLKE